MKISTKFNLSFNLFLLVIVLTGLMVSSCKTKDLMLKEDVDKTATIPALVKFIDVDNLGNIYVVDQKDRLQKYTLEGKKLFEFYNKRLGNITSIDASNPMQILVYFGDYGTIKILDNTLAEIKSIDLTKDGKFVGIETVCKANDDNFWIVDPTSQKILKVNNELKILVETNTFYDIGLPQVEALKMREAGNHLVLMTKNDGFVVFDNFGQYNKTIYGNNIEDFQFDGKGILYRTMTNYRYQSLKFPDFSFMSLPLSVDQNRILGAKKLPNFWVIAYANGVNVIKNIDHEK